MEVINAKQFPSTIPISAHSLILLGLPFLFMSIITEWENNQLYQGHSL